MTDLLNQLNQTLFGPGLTVAVFSAGLFLFFLVGRFPLFHPKQTLRALTEPSKDGISPIKAMTVALAGTLGVGNIAGVASAIAVGGAGAVFWMWLSAFAAMPIKYAETLLAVRHRRLRNKQMHGGAFFYMEDRRGKLFSFAALVFAILCLTAALTMGCMVQSNAVAVSFSDTFSLSPRLVALSLGVLTFAVVSGGLSQISSLTVRLIPAMSALYLILSLFILFTHPAAWGRVFGEIFAEAFSGKAVGGGLLGFLSSNALRLGVTRGIFSSEAGCGTAPIVHASANVDHPARQGLFGMLEVFFDTVVMCSLTAFVVLIAKDGGLSLPADGMSAASLSFGKFLPFAPKLLAVAVFVFAFARSSVGFITAAKAFLILQAASDSPRCRRKFTRFCTRSAQRLAVFCRVGSCGRSRIFRSV